MKKEEIEKLAIERFPIILRPYNDGTGEIKHIDILFGDRMLWIEGFNKALELNKP